VGECCCCQEDAGLGEFFCLMMVVGKKEVETQVNWRGNLRCSGHDYSCIWLRELIVESLRDGVVLRDSDGVDWDVSLAEFYCSGVMLRRQQSPETIVALASFTTLAAY
jgi:hypothetical protein